jgi:ribosome-associated toxin RatA of RatAB toxin-antitoxin module
MAEHHASVTVNAPVDQVYDMFTHFNDFPKFMSFVKEVTYYDEQRSHWVAEVVGQHEWDAVNENWVEDRQIGWRSYNGLENSGRVTFQSLGANQTRVDVYINYDPPAGVLGDIGENLGVGARFDNVLQHDLDNFARMVDQAPPGALDPESSNYLFQSGSAATKGTTTQRQDETMGEGSRSSYTTDYGTASGTGYDAVSGTTSDTGYATNTGTGYDTTAGTNYDTAPGTPRNTDVDTTMNRPILDKDIIGEQQQYTPSPDVTAEDRTPDTYAIEEQETVILPDSSGVQNPVTPPEYGENRNPVMPDTNVGAQNPVMPSEDTIVRDPVMPPEDIANRNPVMPPERDKDTGY